MVPSHCGWFHEKKKKKKGEKFFFNWMDIYCVNACGTSNLHPLIVLEWLILPEISYVNITSEASFSNLSNIKNTYVLLKGYWALE